jgi:hypothetical protein
MILKLIEIDKDVLPLYLQRGSMSPIGYLIERSQQGRAIAKREGLPATVR